VGEVVDDDPLPLQAAENKEAVMAACVTSLAILLENENVIKRIDMRSDCTRVTW
jgi:hypothetical protein